MFSRTHLSIFHKYDIQIIPTFICRINKIKLEWLNMVVNKVINSEVSLLFFYSITIADAMVSTGLAAAGYKYINLGEISITFTLCIHFI